MPKLRKGKQSIKYLLSLPQRERRAFLMTLRIDLRVELQYRLNRVLESELAAELKSYQVKSPNRKQA